MNPARAAQYVTQALGRLAELEAAVPIPTDSVGAWVSLRRNLESAAADLKPAE